MNQENKNIIYYGSKEDIPLKIALKAGNLDLFYENGFIRYIKLGNQEVIRMINHAVRDHNWGTIPLRIFDEIIEKNKDSFSIHYRAEAKQSDIHFLWKCTIIGEVNNTITFNIEGESLTSFKRNRIGFTVLHPIQECEGKEVRIKNHEGKTEVKIFPKLISPVQPFFNVQSMEWNLEKNIALLKFSGDIFETEDQRNWIDASYKTYCTPLGLPFPVVLKKGDKVKQIIQLSVMENFDLKASETTNHTFSIAKDPVTLPQINIGQSSEVDELSLSEIEKIKAIPFDAYQVDIKLYEDNWEKKLQRAIQESKVLGFPLELSLFFDSTKKELEALIIEIQKAKPAISIINIFNKEPHVTQKETVDIVLPVFRKLFPIASIGAGTNAFFTELNRDRQVLDKMDHLVYSINPQVHAFDNDSLTETIAAQPYTIQTSKSFSQGKPIHISPITFKMRWNPNATGDSVVSSGKLPAEVDVRQMSLFAASWVLGTFNSLLAFEPASLTFFETIGLKGIMQSAKPIHPDQFFASANLVYPMYFVFKIIMEHKDWDFYPLTLNQPLDFTGLAMAKKGKKISLVLIANYSSDTISVKISSTFNNFKVKFINDKNIVQLMADSDKFDKLRMKNFQNNLEIDPYGIAMLKRE